MTPPRSQRIGELADRLGELLMDLAAAEESARSLKVLMGQIGHQLGNAEDLATLDAEHRRD